MTIESHSRGLEGSHKMKEEYSKENGIWRKLSDEEYVREKDDIEIHLKVLMELL